MGEAGGKLSDDKIREIFSSNKWQNKDGIASLTMEGLTPDQQTQLYGLLKEHATVERFVGGAPQDVPYDVPPSLTFGKEKGQILFSC